MSILLLMFFPITACARHYPIIHDNQTNYQIVVKDEEIKKFPSLKFAAKELQHYLHEMTGVMIPIVNKRDEPERAIFLANDNSLPPAGFRIWFTQHRDIHITGHNTGHSINKNTQIVLTHGMKQCFGTLHGVYRFLKMQGCGWYNAGPEGESIPKKGRIDVDESLNLSDAPYFPYRMLNRGPKHDNDSFRGIWLVRNGGGDNIGQWHGHYHGRAMGLNSFFPSPWCDSSDNCTDDISDGHPLRCGHPEYFAMTKGPVGTHWDYQLANSTGYTTEDRTCEMHGRIHGGQVCMSNPGTVKAFVDYYNWFFDTNPHRVSVAFGANDGGGFCECLFCRSLDGSVNPFDLYGDLDGDRDVDLEDVAIYQSLTLKEKNQIDFSRFTMTGPEAGEKLDWYNHATWRRNLTDRFLKFNNEVAVGVAATHPDKFLCPYIYGYYRDPPVRQHNIHSNLRPTIAYNSLWRMDNEVFEYIDSLLQYWGQHLPNRMTSYDIGCWMSLGVPSPVGQRMIDLIKSHKDNKLLGGLIYSGPSWESFGFDTWLWVQLLWDPFADVEELKEEYYRGLFGIAAPEVQAYYDLLTSRREKLMKNLMGYHRMPNFKGLNAFHSLIVNTYAPLRPSLESTLQRAESKSSEMSEKELFRLGKVRANWELTKYTVAALASSAVLENNPSPITKTMRIYRDSIDKRNQCLSSLRSTTCGRVTWSQIHYDETHLMKNDNRLSASNSLYHLSAMNPQEAGMTIVDCPIETEKDVKRNTAPGRFIWGNNTKVSLDTSTAASGVASMRIEPIKLYNPQLPSGGKLFKISNLSLYYDNADHLSSAPNGIIKYSMRIKTSKMEKERREGALRAYVKLSDDNNEVVFTQWKWSKSGDFNEWSYYSVHAKIPPTATKSTFTLYVHGEGAVWIDDFKIEIFKQ